MSEQQVQDSNNEFLIEKPERKQLYRSISFAAYKKTDNLSYSEAIQLLRDYTSYTEFLDRIVVPPNSDKYQVINFTRSVLIPMINSTDPRDPYIEILWPLIETVIYHLRKCPFDDHTASDLLQNIETRYPEQQDLVYELTIKFFTGWGYKPYRMKNQLTPPSPNHLLNQDYIAHALLLDGHLADNAPVTKYILDKYANTINDKYTGSRAVEMLATIYNSLNPVNASRFNETVRKLTNNELNIGRYAWIYGIKQRIEDHLQILRFITDTSSRR